MANGIATLTPQVDAFGAFQEGRQARQSQRMGDIKIESAEQKRKLEDAVLTDFELEKILTRGTPEAQQEAIDYLNRETTLDEADKADTIRRLQAGDTAGILNEIKQDRNIARQLGVLQSAQTRVSEFERNIGRLNELSDRDLTEAEKREKDLIEQRLGTQARGGVDVFTRELEKLKGQREGGVVELEGAKAGAKETAKLEAKAKLAPAVEQAVALAREVGKQKGEAQAKLNSMVAQFPNLNNMVTELSELGKKATFTTVGQIGDTVRRELGLPVGEGAVARTEYIAKVDNEVLPLLKQTFGAAFTVQEGESLRATLGDPDKSPEEKDAVLRAFIAAKSEEIKSLGRQTGTPITEDITPAPIGQPTAGIAEGADQVILAEDFFK